MPETAITPHADPTEKTTLTYTGSATVVPMTNNNPYGAGNDVTMNTVAAVEFRVDGGPWQWSNPVDGNYDDAVEQYTFTTTVSRGTHTIEARAWNSIGNVDPTPAMDTVTVPKAKSINFMSSGFLENYPNLFPVLRLLINRFIL